MKKYSTSLGGNSNAKHKVFRKSKRFKKIFRENGGKVWTQLNSQENCMKD